MMKTFLRAVFLCSCFCVIGLPSDTLSAQQTTNLRDTQVASAPGGVSAVFREAKSVLRRESGVPPELPRFLPFMDESHPIHAVVQSAAASGYSILLANALPCDGANWCLYGTVNGSTHPIDREGKGRKAVPVLLRGGIKASFVDSECDTHCSQAYVDWQENGYYYSIGIKGPNSMRKTLLKVVNSAIGTTGRR